MFQVNTEKQGASLWQQTFTKFCFNRGSQKLCQGWDPIGLWAALALNHPLSSHQWFCSQRVAHCSRSGHLVQLAGHSCNACHSWTRQNIQSTHGTVKHCPIIILRPSVKKGRNKYNIPEHDSKGEDGHC